VKDPGSIQLTSVGVSIRDRRSRVHAFEWKSVERILAYKVDLITTDDVCLEFIAAGKFFIADEETNGWSDLTTEVNQRFPIHRSWLEDVIDPAFTTNLVVLWDRSVQEALLSLSSERVEQLWQLLQRDFRPDGAHRKRRLPDQKAIVGRIS
jgi:hypothetical protein